MNILKIALLAFMIMGFCACNDDEKENINGGGVTPETSKVAVSFQETGKTVLKNAGVINIPIAFAEAAPEQIKVAVSVKMASGDSIAKEGIDFTIAEKVVVVEKGASLANLEILLNNDEKTGVMDKVFELQIAGVYGGGKKAADKQSCVVSIVNNAFVEFEKGNWVTYEAAATAGATTADSRFIPIVITGAVKESCKVVLEVVDNSAQEYQHFTLVTKEIVLNPGDQRVMVEVKPIDDVIANTDRQFSLRMKEIVGGNLIFGKNNTTCGVTIISEEVLKLISFKTTNFTKDDDEQFLEIPVVLDKAPDADVTVEIKAKETSTAVAGVDFEFTEGMIVIPANSKNGVLKIKIIGNNTIEADRVLELVFKSVNGSNTEIADKDNLCTVKITNNDFPSFAKELTLVEEDQLDYKLAIAIPAVDKERILKISYENYEASDGTYYTIKSTDITVPANATEAFVDMKIGYTLDFPTENPALKIKVTEVDGFSLLDKEIGTTVNLAACTFRKMLGEWTVSFKSAIGADAATGPFTLTFAVKSSADFNKVITCNGGWAKSSTWQFSSHLSFNKQTGKIAAVTNEVVMTQKPFGDGSDVKFYCNANLPLLSWEATNNANYTELSWNGYWSVGIFSVGTSNKTGDWMHFENIKMVKK